MTLETTNLVLIGLTGAWFLLVAIIFGCLALISATLSPERYRTNFGDAMRRAFGWVCFVLAQLFVFFVLRLFSDGSNAPIEPIAVTIGLRALLVLSLIRASQALVQLLTSMIELARERFGGDVRLSALLWAGTRTTVADLINRLRRDRREPPQPDGLP